MSCHHGDEIFKDVAEKQQPLAPERGRTIPFYVGRCNLVRRDDVVAPEYRRRKVNARVQFSRAKEKAEKNAEARTTSPGSGR